LQSNRFTIILVLFTVEPKRISVHSQIVYVVAATAATEHESV
jgi:hypothetical protein